MPVVHRIRMNLLTASGVFLVIASGVMNFPGLWSTSSSPFSAMSLRKRIRMSTRLVLDPMPLFFIKKIAPALAGHDGLTAGHFVGQGSQELDVLAQL
jgi:hypothetical protein